MSVIQLCGVPTNIRRVEGKQFINGKPVDFFASRTRNEIVVTDDGDRDRLIARAALAVAMLVAPAPVPDANGIEEISGPLPSCPVLPHDEGPSLFRPRRGFGA